jgi:hypothetical protein
MSKAVGEISLPDHLRRIVHAPRHAVLAAEGTEVLHAGSLRPEKGVLDKGRRIGRAGDLTKVVEGASVADVDGAAESEGAEVSHGETLCG